MDQTDDSGSFYNQKSTDLSTDKEINTDIESISNTSINKEIKIFIDKINSYHGKYILKALRTKMEKENPINRSKPIKIPSETTVDQTTSQDEDQKSDIESSITDDIETKNEPKIINEKTEYKITSTLDPERDKAIEVDFCNQEAPNFYETLLEQDFIIYDINFDLGNVNDALRTIKLLENWCKNSQKDVKPKHFILISNLMTWAMTE